MGASLNGGNMNFRPCIDIHDGKVKQIVGGSLSDSLGAETNFVADQDAGFFGRLYKRFNLKGGHIILLNKAGTPEYDADMAAAELALKEYPDGLMIGGGVTAENAAHFIDMGATHVIVTSYVFRDGMIDFDRLNKLISEVGREHLVLDLSCRLVKESQEYYIVTDRWQKFTDAPLNHDTLDLLKKYSDEYLIHAVDVEGKRAGIDEKLMTLLGSWENAIPITYAGGVSSFDDLDAIRKLGNGRIDVTIGSALSIFGGDMDFDEVIRYFR